MFCFLSCIDILFFFATEHCWTQSKLIQIINQIMIYYLIGPCIVFSLIVFFADLIFKAIISKVRSTEDNPNKLCIYES